MFNRIHQTIANKLHLCSNLKRVPKISQCTFKTATDGQYEEVLIPVPWGHIAGKWWGPKNKKPIFTFHGWQDNCGSFDLLLQLLPKHLSFLALDFPGHGYSSKLPAGIVYEHLMGYLLVRRLQAYFDFEKIALMGHSLGAIVSYTYSGLYPHAVDFLICIDGLNPVVNPRRLDRVVDSMEGYLKYDAQVVQTQSQTVEPPAYSMETLVEKVHKGTRGSIDKDKCHYIIARNVRESQSQPGLFYFDRDPRLKSGPFFNWPMEDLLEHARRISPPILATKAAQMSPPFKNLELHSNIKDIIVGANPRAEFHDVKGTHFGHLNSPKIFAEIIPKFIEKYDAEHKDIDPKIFKSIKK